jgi:hypothetical protein
MSPKKFDPQTWGRQLDAGAQSDPQLRLAAQLEQSRPAARPLDPHFHEALRSRLLAQAGVAPAQRLGRLAASLAVMLLLAAAVALFWTSQAATHQTTLPGTGDEQAQTVNPNLLELQGTVTQVELELHERAMAPAESWELRRIRQTIAGDDLIVAATLAYTFPLTDAATILALVPADWQPGEESPTEAVAQFLLDTNSIPRQADEMTVEFVVDPLEVWEQSGSFDLLLALIVDRPAADGRITETTIFTDRPITLRTEGLDRLWLHSVSPEPDTPLDQTAFTVELGYRLLSAPAAEVRLLVAHPGWESANLGASERLPVKGAGDPVSVTRGEGIVIFTFTTEHAAYLHDVIGAEVTLAANMLVPGADGVMQALDQRTFADYLWPVAAAQPGEADRLWFVSISPEPGATVEEGGLLTAVIGYELYSADTGSIYLALTHAEWEGVSPPSAPFGGQSVAAGAGQIELQLTVDNLAGLQARAGQQVRLEAFLGAADEHNQYQQLATAVLDDAPWRLGVALVGVPRLMPQVAIFPDNRGEATVTRVTRLDIQNIESSASSAAGMAPITFTVRLAYQLAAHQAESATVTIYIAAAGTGARVPLALVAETVAAGRGIIEATFDFNPQRDLHESARRLPRSYELLITIDRQDGTPLTYTGTSPDWEFRP